MVVGYVRTMAGQEGRSRRGGALAVLGRTLVALGIAGLAALVLRLRGSGGTPPHRGGWRQLSARDLGGPETER